LIAFAPCGLLRDRFEQQLYPAAHLRLNRTGKRHHRQCRDRHCQKRFFFGGEVEPRALHTGVSLGRPITPALHPASVSARRVTATPQMEKRMYHRTGHGKPRKPTNVDGSGQNGCQNKNWRPNEEYRQQARAALRHSYRLSS